MLTRRITGKRKNLPTNLMVGLKPDLTFCDKMAEAEYIPTRRCDKRHLRVADPNNKKWSTNKTNFGFKVCFYQFYQNFNRYSQNFKISFKDVGKNGVE